MSFPNIIQQINSKLSLSGGTMTGSITSNVTNSLLSSAESFMNIGYNWSDESGALIAFRSSEYTSNPGSFAIFARTPEASSSLNGNPNGTLTWNGANVITSAGGTMTGNLVFDGVANTGLRCADNSSRLSMVASNAFDSACIHLWGSTNDGNYPGCVEIIPRIETTYTVWRFTPDGKFQKGTNIIHYITTTYSSGTTWYRVYSDGWKEMGGKCTPNNYDGMTVTLPKAFSNTNYEVIASSCDTVNKRSAQAWAKTASTIGVRTIAGTGQSQTPMWWYACGY